MTEKEQTIQEITTKFAGKWKQVRSENTEAFFQEMGINFLLRKMASKASPDCDISVNGIDIAIGFKTSFRTESFTYKLDEEVEITNDKGKFMCLLEYRDGKVMITARPSPGNSSKPMETVREINSAGELETTFKVGDVVCKRYFVRADK